MADITDREENAIKDFQAFYYAICIEKYADEDNYFSFENYMKEKNPQRLYGKPGKPKKSIFGRIVDFFNL
ncbi:hypothetical protein [Chryseobacterium jejuense]|uniref:hypothetical protein n=1 Tax=Chryseobacterium jejuense TaxID=445960 RepID=UPI001AE11F68|nr:hypothetical protein [Chryseobacterium jejuense]MBP2619556.1 hypothetical protein [Chryseobacterium jejuense]